MEGYHNACVNLLLNFPFREIGIRYAGERSLGAKTVTNSCINVVGSPPPMSFLENIHQARFCTRSKNVVKRKLILLKEVVQKGIFIKKEEHPRYYSGGGTFFG